ncbi:MAG: beta-ketoacyl-[acyl-carrier-protein] synthase family protein [Sporolactobacillus sp.]
MSEEARIVVTGLGAITPFGQGIATMWKNLIDGRSAVGETSDEYLRQWAPVTAEAKLFSAKDFMDGKMVRKTDRFSQMAMVAASEALADAGWNNREELANDYDSDRIGIAMGCAFGGVQTLEAGSSRLTNGAPHVGPRLVPKSIPNAAGAAIAQQWAVHGPVITYSTACASSANAIGEASYWLRLGEADMVIAGGAECLFSPAILAGLRSAGALAKEGPEQAEAWSRPFAVDRAGMVMGEGAGMMILESYEHAVRRGAKIYAEFSGYGASDDAYHETAPDPSGSGAAFAIKRALRQAGIKRAQVSYINAHATATKAGDAAECAALRMVFGDTLDKIPVSSIKGAIGHLLGAAGAIESIACIKALETSILPPTINCDKKDAAAPADIVPNVGRRQASTYALSNSFGFGGQNGVLIWKKA